MLAGRADNSVAHAYDAMVAVGAIDSSATQRALVGRLDSLVGELVEIQRGRALSFLARRRARKVKGLYIFGEVGRGKTMLMDAFFTVAPVAAKRRVHFDAFMGEVQDAIHAARGNGSGDPIARVAEVIVRETRLLCLDEFAVNDIADAMILARLFAVLFQRGLVLVATSNSAPEDLYREGLNRSLFLPFIGLLKRHLDVFRLEGATDYRLAKLTGAPVYLTPAGATARATLDGIWRRLTGTVRGTPTALRTRGRDIGVPEASDGIARFQFDDLCRAPLGANDYLQIARAYHTLLVDEIPVIGADERDVARRLILFVDTLYDHGVKLVASAATEPGGLFVAVNGDEALAFRRTVSRLIEMRSQAYLAAEHGRPAAARSSPGGAPPLAPQHQSG